MRKLVLLVAAVALMGGTLSACFGGSPPPTPKDVLVVGDSVSFSFGCVLGDPGTAAGAPPQSDCPQSPDYTTRNDWQGACTIAPGTLSLYNGGQVGVPNCDTAPGGSEGKTWAQDADQYTPKVVVINTGGWEIVDRWDQASPPAAPDYQWGGTTGGPSTDPYHTATAYYSNQLKNAIDMFRSKGATVIVANAPYISPPQPEPPPGSVPQGLECSWWQPYPATNTTPSSGPDCTGNATAGSGGLWRSPTGNTSYRSSKTQMTQLNGIIDFVKSTYYSADNRVVVFDFKKHFDDGPNDAYTNYVCPPPTDSTVAATNTLDFHSGVTPGTMAYQCDNGQINSPATPWPYAILARAADQGHLSADGMFDVLKPYIDACVRNYLGLSGGDPTKCN